MSPNLEVGHACKGDGPDFLKFTFIIFLVLGGRLDHHDYKFDSDDNDSGDLIVVPNLHEVHLAGDP